MNNKQIIILAAIFFGVAGIMQAFFTVDQRERVILFQFGEIVGVDFEPGLHFKIPFIQTVSRVEGRVITLDGQSEEFLTSEKKNVKVDFYVKWRVADTVAYYRATAGQELVAGDRLSSIVNRALRDQFSIRTIRQAVSDERGDITVAVERATAEPASELGIALVDVRVKAIDLPDQVSESVYQRMRAERQRVASDFRARGAEQAERIRADADREAEVILANAYREAETLRGEGDASSAAIYAQAYGEDAEFYSFYRSLGVYRDAFSGKDDVLILEPDSQLFRYFNQSAVRR
jgi:membrane protease subunit HflC